MAFFDNNLKSFFIKQIKETEESVNGTIINVEDIVTTNIETNYNKENK